MAEATAVLRGVGLLGESKNEVYELSRVGTFALLRAVSAADTKAATAMASKPNPCDAVIAYLDAAFLGPFLRSGQEIPYAENAGELGTYIKYLDSELARGESHATLKLQTYLKLLAYVTAIEAPVPLAVFTNALRFLAGGSGGFDFAINHGAYSASQKLGRVTNALRTVSAPPGEFVALHARLAELCDSVLRNAVSHSTYRVRPDRKRVDVWKAIGGPSESRTFEQVAQAYEDARCYLLGFFARIGDFANQIHPDCPYAWYPSR
jgi:hypothetical protein